MRFQVLIHFGRTAMPCRTFRSYASARRFARSLHRASIRPELAAREWRALYALGIVVTAASLAYSIGA